jgi:translation initiation factor eIF-2B subunit gamma
LLTKCLLDITLIAPPESKDAIEAALSQNPHLTSLASPKPDILAPEGITQTSGTAEIFRTPEVQSAITSDFIILPCDLVSELDGSSLVDAWMLHEAGLGAATGGIKDFSEAPMSIGGEKSGRRGGLGVWFQTKGETSTKNEETDFVATTPLPAPIVPPPTDSLSRDVSKLVLSMPTAALKDVAEEKKCLPIRHALLRTHGRIKMLTTYRDAHIYFFPFWVKEMIAQNERFDSIAEDVLGWWAKAGWQEGLGDKLGLREILQKPSSSGGDDTMDASQLLDDQVDLTDMISTWSPEEEHEQNPAQPTSFASRVVRTDTLPSPLPLSKGDSYPIPPLLAYVQPTSATIPFIRRVDTAPLLLSVSLRLARLPSVEESRSLGTHPSPFAHPAKIAHREAIPQKCRVEADNSLLAENVIVEEKCNIKECVIGVGCKIGSGARLLRCLLMDGVEVGENCQLTGCILGRRCRIEGGVVGKDGDKTVLKDCQVQEGQVIEWGSKFCTSFAPLPFSFPFPSLFPFLPSFYLISLFLTNHDANSSAAEGTNESYMRFEGLSDDDEAMEQAEEDLGPPEE